MTTSDRSNILVIGKRSIDAGPFNRRRLTLTPIAIKQLDVEHMNDARGVLLAVQPGKVADINKYFRDSFHRVCELGLMTAVYATDSNDRAQAVAMRDAAYARFKVEVDEERPLHWVYIGEAGWAIAENFARYDAGPPLW